MKLNMNLFKKILVGCLLVFFGGGLFLGGNLFKNFKYIKEPQTLNLLLYSHFIPPETIKEIESENNLKINVDFADSLYEIEDKLKDPKAKYDLVSIYSFQAIQLDEEARLQPINWSFIKNQKNISSDFMSLGGDDLAKKLLPLSWGVNGFAYDSSQFSDPVDSWESVLTHLGPKNHILLFDIPLSLYQLGTLNNLLRSKSQAKAVAPEQNIKNLLNSLLKFSDLYHLGSGKLPDAEKFVLVEMSHAEIHSDKGLENFKFVIPKEGGLFWTLSLAEPRFAPHPKELAIFLGAILEKKSALAILNFDHLSTTSQTLNSESIDPRLKSQYIREIPLTRIKFQSNFNDSALFSQLIEEVQKHGSQ